MRLGQSEPTNEQRPSEFPPPVGPVAQRPPARIDGSPHAHQVIETVQTVFTALALAFIFRAFFVEAFIIPTGSMAQSLLGAHATRTCPACGWEFDFSPAGDCLCPNCHLRTPLEGDQPAIKAGDRILVHKWPFALGNLLAPQRWDVIVFRNPSDASENYIKRLIGRPGETVEIIDGDVFIDGRIARKTPAAQSVLWFPVFDQNHCPTAPAATALPARWVAVNTDADPSSGWSGLQTRLIQYRGPDDRARAIRFAPAGDARYFEDLYAYNRGPSRPDAPLVADVRVSAEVTFRAGDGCCRWILVRDGHRFVAEAYRDGRLRLLGAARDDAGDMLVFDERRLPPFAFNRPYVVDFAHVDFRAYLAFDGQEVLSTNDSNYAPDLWVLRRVTRTAPVDLQVSAAGLDLDLRGLRVDRDVYYTYRERFTQRAYAGHPFVLEPNEYFVLGDNSPDSRDSREWDDHGLHLCDGYRIGTVRADQIVGPAAFVYLPGLLDWTGSGRWRLPDLGRVRFVR